MIKIIIDGSRELPYQSFVFSGGEVSVKLSTPKFDFKNVTILACIDSSDELMKLLMIKDALGRFGCLGVIYKLIMPYLPYARQDRVCADGEALSIKVVANLINSMKFDKVKVYDCHSDVGVALLDNCYNVGQDEIFGVYFNRFSEDGFEDPVLISPDAGANKKVLSLGKRYGLPVLRADKTRDPKTGGITGTVVYGDCTGIDAVIVDDICDGGRTFTELAKQLIKGGARSVTLIVTHGIFSKGTEVLFYSGINRIITTDSIYKGESSENIEVVTC